MDWSPDIDKLQALDDGEWLAVERNYCGRLLSFAARKVPDVQGREDVVQEAFLGAVRGIQGFNRDYGFQQWLFSICRNRSIDYLRRRKLVNSSSLAADEDDCSDPLDRIAPEQETPSAIVRADDTREAGRQLLAETLRAWVQETWQQGEFKRLMILEALFRGGWRNRDTWQRFDLQNETAVAGIKFRALKRLRALAEERDPAGEILESMGDLASESGANIDVGDNWRTARVSCPARHWLARFLKPSGLDEGARAFLTFHLDEMHCEECAANLDDLRAGSQADREQVVERIGESTIKYLRSRTLPGQG
ncbi:MAG: hypothetical protein CMJ87_10685 [Planctomycetes bacterium]|nr:hypothetical protein [Planctomycetota bacterium]